MSRMSSSWKRWAGRSSREAARPGHEAAPGRTTVLAGLAVVLLGGLVGCGLLSPTDRDEARVRVTGDTAGTPDSAARVHIATSTDFRAADSTSAESASVPIELLSADTLFDRELPFDREFPLGESARFYVEVLPADSVTTNVVLEVFIDGERRSEQTANIQQDRLTFVFVVSEG